MNKKIEMMTTDAVKGAIAGIVGGQASTYGNSARLAKALIAKEGECLSVREFETALYGMYVEGSPERGAVLQAVRVALSRITGQPVMVKGPDGKEVVKTDANGEAVLVNKKLTLNTKNTPKTDKTIRLEPAQIQDKTDKSGKAVKAAADAAKAGDGGVGADVVTVKTADGAEKVSLSLMKHTLCKRVQEYCGLATIKQREQLAASLLKILTDSGLYLDGSTPKLSGKAPKAVTVIAPEPQQAVG